MPPNKKLTIRYSFALTLTRKQTLVCEKGHLGRKKTKASPIVHFKYKVLKDVNDPTQNTLLCNSLGL